MKKKIFSLVIMAVLLIMYGNVSNAEEKLSFTDVPESAWYYSYLCNAYDQKIIAGFQDNTFRPNEPLTVEQYLKMIVTTVNPKYDFKRSTGDWFSGYMDMATRYSIITAKLTKEERSKKITRGEVAYYTYLASNVGKDNKYILEDLKTVTYYKDMIKDYKDTVGKYEDAIAVLYKYGVISGYQDGTFKPHNYLTRAESTAIITNYLKLRDFDLETGRVNVEEIQNYVY